MLFKASEWRIAGSSGGSVTVGTPIAKIQVGGSRLNLPIYIQKKCLPYVELF